MNILIMKLGATGDVVRTTPLLSKLDGQITWLTDARNVPLLKGLGEGLPRNNSAHGAFESLDGRSSSTCPCGEVTAGERRPFTPSPPPSQGKVLGLSWDERTLVPDINFDLVINLEDSPEVGAYLRGLRFRRLFGAFLDANGSSRYTEDSRRWFDLSLISVHGRQRADELKYFNRQSYQELIFEGLGFRFEGEKYVLPSPIRTDLRGDVAIAPAAGPVWPMKNWAHYAELQASLQAEGLRVNFLPRRSSLLEHMGDVAQHRVLVGGDSLPMHLALGVGTPCVTIFNCTSPWEIFDYGIQTKLVSPLLDEFFYKRGMDVRATTAISLNEVFEATMNRLALTAIA
jgi:heptosyltransferase II